MFQIGGEFLFEDGALTWCHRMTHMRNHTEVHDLMKVLDLEPPSAGLEEEEEEGSIVSPPDSPQSQKSQALSTRLIISNPVIIGSSTGLGADYPSSLRSTSRQPNKLRKKNVRMWSRSPNRLATPKSQ